MEIRKGIGVSPGIAIGQAVVIGRFELRVPRYQIEPDQVPREIRRFWAARRQARDEIALLRDRAEASLGNKVAAIFDAHLKILGDRKLSLEVFRRVRLRLINLEWALTATTNGYLQLLETVEDHSLRERGNDIRDVHDRLQRILAGGKERRDHDLVVHPDSIVVARSLTPSQAMWLQHRRIAGLVTEGGGPTSHTAILANALEIPAVLGTGQVLEAVGEGDPIVVDGFSGEVVLDPSPAALETYRRFKKGHPRCDVAPKAECGPVVTTDGITIHLLANIEFPEELPTLERVGAEGVGLYRSEFLFLSCAPREPQETDHLEACRRIAAASLPGPIVVRTLDLGGDKLIELPRGRASEGNPALGLRAVRYGLAHPDIFRTQLRGLLRAAAEIPRLKILVPMISGLPEWRRVRELVRDVSQELEREGRPVPGVPLGCMIEVPGAALIADLLAREADFLSIGSNDLIQYTLAVDRGNSAVAYLYDPWHPAVLRLITQTIRAGAAASIPVHFCGEMASDPLGALTLLGLGVTELSCNPVMIPAIRALIKRSGREEARRAVEQAQERVPEGEIRAALLEVFGERIGACVESFTSPLRYEGERPLG